MEIDRPGDLLYYAKYHHDKVFEYMSICLQNIDLLHLLL